jgi:hypothetical protein
MYVIAVYTVPGSGNGWNVIVNEFLKIDDLAENI